MPFLPKARIIKLSFHEHQELKRKELTAINPYFLEMYRINLGDNNLYIIEPLKTKKQKKKCFKKMKTNFY